MRAASIDCLVVGGGPAGLAAAVQLGRLRRSSVVDDDAGRSLAGHSHQVTTAAHLGATTATAVNYDLYDPVERGVRT